MKLQSLNLKKKENWNPNIKVLYTILLNWSTLFNEGGT